MGDYARDLQRRIDAAVEALDPDALDKLLDEHFEEVERSVRPYGAAVGPKAEYREELGPDRFEGDALVNWANRIARARRFVAFKLKSRGNFQGTKLVSEGDSWFQYPLLLRDVIDNVMDEQDFAVLSLGAAADLVEHMATRREYSSALTKTGAPIMLLSGGGNDLLGEGRLATILNPYSDGAGADDLIDDIALATVSDRILGFYGQILGDVAQNHSGVKVIGHGYDTPFPRAGGAHFGQPFEDAGIPLDVGREVIEKIVSFFRLRLAGLQTEFDNFRFVDLVGTVGTSSQSWKDELHPQNAGFERATAPLIDAIREEIRNSPSGSFETAPRLYPLGGFDVESGAPSTRPQLEAAPVVPAGPSFESATKVVVLDPGHGGTAPNGGSSPNNARGPRGSLEKTWTLDICIKVQSVLRLKGFECHLTREGDTNPSLSDRRETAKSKGADCFISLHFNGFNGSAQGTETFVHNNTTSPSSVRLMRLVQARMVDALGHRDRNAANGVEGVLRQRMALGNHHAVGDLLVVHDRPAATLSADHVDITIGKPSLEICVPLEVAQRHGGAVPAIDPQDGGIICAHLLQQGLIDRHVPRPS